MPGADRADDAFSGAEELGLGPTLDQPAGQDRRGVEEEGEEVFRRLVGGDAEDGEIGPIADRIRRQFSVSGRAGEAGGGGGASCGARGDLQEDGGGLGASAAADKGVVSQGCEEQDRGARGFGPRW